MQHLHGFLHSNETDQNEPEHHYWVQKRGFGAFVSFLAQNYASFRFWPETMHRFVNDLNRCIKYNPSMVFCTVTKLTKTNQNITIGCVRFVSGSGAFVSFLDQNFASFR